MPRDINWRRGRGGRPWQRLRAQVLAEETYCWLCGRPVDKNLPGSHQLGPNVDHVRPLAHNGAPLDRANVRLAHRRCNLARGTKTPAPTQRRRW